MMNKSHNKKRNVGIIYEQLLRKVSHCLVEQNNDTSEKALAVLKRHFKPGTQLYKEFRLFNALVKTTVDTDSLACRILAEARRAAQDHDAALLRTEKSALIRDINHVLGDPSFYSQRVEDYRTYATIQTLLNDWRAGDASDLSRVAKYENVIVEWLTRKCDVIPLNEHRNADVNTLTVKIMTEKFNSKYGAILNEQQRDIIKQYALSQESGGKEFVTYLGEVKKGCMQELRRYSRICDNKILNEKMKDVLENIKRFDVSTVDDDSLAKFLLLSKLSHELGEERE
jgi:hypothetical protein